MAQLREFYRAVNRNVKGISDDRWFYSDCGLCANLLNYTMHINGAGYQKSYRALHERMRYQFKKAGLSSFLPFNKKTSYRLESKDGLMYKNEARLKWIRDHV